MYLYYSINGFLDFRLYSLSSKSSITASETSQSIATTPDPPKKVKTFANPQHLPKHDKEKRLGLEVGDRILTPTYQHGTLRYKGDVDFASGTWAGVELDTPTGKNDGSMKHRRCVFCIYWTTLTRSMSQ